jgi:hypothetical protein
MKHDLQLSQVLLHVGIAPGFNFFSPSSPLLLLLGRVRVAWEEGVFRSCKSRLLCKLPNVSPPNVAVDLAPWNPFRLLLACPPVFDLWKLQHKAPAGDIGVPSKPAREQSHFSGHPGM